MRNWIITTIYGGNDRAYVDFGGIDKLLEQGPAHWFSHAIEKLGLKVPSHLNQKIIVRQWADIYWEKSPEDATAFLAQKLQELQGVYHEAITFLLQLELHNPPSEVMPEEWKAYCRNERIQVE